jgi:type III restriction enzyme
MPEKLKISPNDLVLEVSENVDPRKFDISKYEDFMDAVFGNRYYHKEVVKKALFYFLGENYKNLKDLALQNYKTNEILQKIFPRQGDYEKHLQLPDKLSATIEEATATGKSYVLYVIARIMLAEGVVNRVLVLCPSTTIESGLTEKFKELSSDPELLRLLPQDAKIKNPRIISGDETIKEGDICIENIHAVYERTGSSIRASLKGKGQETLVLNDEVHHVYNKPGRDKAIKLWKIFLQNSDFNFKYVLGVTGTPYIENEYFYDVIYRYSLRQAIEDGFVKLIKYAVEGGAATEEEQFKMVYEHHLKNKRKYRKIKPLSIIITRDINTCKDLTERWVKFISKIEKIPKTEAEKKVLIVTSADEHKQNVLKLRNVDDKENPVEWITSVSMLSEGWDVKNVFQIVPHEKRAFNSKLLIAQVLGRGLRIPPHYAMEKPEVIIFNHVKWAPEIRQLVEEVMEIELRLHIYPIKEKDEYNFKIHQIIYELKEKPRETKFKTEGPKKIKFSPQVESLEKETEFEKAVTREREIIKARVIYDFYTVEQVANDIWNRLVWDDREFGTNFSKKFTLKKIKRLLKDALKKIGEKNNRISEENKLKAIQAFGIFRRKKTKSPKYEISIKKINDLNTKDLKQHSISISALRKGLTIFFDENSMKYSNEEDKKILESLPEDEAIPASALGDRYIKNTYFFKTPTNICVASSSPERIFVKKLVEKDNSELVDGWIKSRDVGFYSIDYYWRKGEHHKKGSFNPDFFLWKKKNNMIIVVEIKEDALIEKIGENSTDVAKEHKAKYKFAKDHFERLNKNKKIKTKYFFTYLTPKDFDKFFEYLRQGKIEKFNPEINIALGG